MALAKIQIKPKLIVFDLDCTLWPFSVDDYYYTPPYKKDNNGRVYDRKNKEIKCFSDVPGILKSLYEHNIDMAVASRTSYPEGALSLINLFNWNDYFKYKEIYPGRKLTHFDKFKLYTHYQYTDMLFFDDETRNINDISSLGVTSILVDSFDGLSFQVVNEGLKRFAENKSKK